MIILLSYNDRNANILKQTENCQLQLQMGPRWEPADLLKRRRVHIVFIQETKWRAQNRGRLAVGTSFSTTEHQSITTEWLLN